MRHGYPAHRCRGTSTWARPALRQTCCSLITKAVAWVIRVAAAAAVIGGMAAGAGLPRPRPGGEPRKASQRNTRRRVSPAGKAITVWRASMPVLCKDRAGIFRRDVGDGEHAEIV